MNRVVTSTRSVRLAAMENENIANRGVAVEVGPTLASVGGQGGENGAPQAEGLVTTTGGDALDTQMKETLQSTEGGIVISSTIQHILDS